MRATGELNHCEENKVQDFLWQETILHVWKWQRKSKWLPSCSQCRWLWVRCQALSFGPVRKLFQKGQKNHNGRSLLKTDLMVKFWMLVLPLPTSSPPSLPPPYRPLQPIKSIKMRAMMLTWSKNIFTTIPCAADWCASHWECTSGWPSRPAGTALAPDDSNDQQKGKNDHKRKKQTHRGKKWVRFLRLLKFPSKVQGIMAASHRGDWRQLMRKRR